MTKRRGRDVGESTDNPYADPEAQRDPLRDGGPSGSVFDPPDSQAVDEDQAEGDLEARGLADDQVSRDELGTDGDETQDERDLLNNEARDFGTQEPLTGEPSLQDAEPNAETQVCLEGPEGSVHQVIAAPVGWNKDRRINLSGKNMEVVGVDVHGRWIFRQM